MPTLIQYNFVSDTALIGFTASTRKGPCLVSSPSVDSGCKGSVMVGVTITDIHDPFVYRNVELASTATLVVHAASKPKTTRSSTVGVCAANRGRGELCESGLGELWVRRGDRHRFHVGNAQRIYMCYSSTDVTCAHSHPALPPHSPSVCLQVIMTSVVWYMRVGVWEHKLHTSARLHTKTLYVIIRPLARFFRGISPHAPHAWIIWERLRR